jgi:uncharacterized membrane protein (UPF0127 family)
MNWRRILPVVFAAIVFVGCNHTPTATSVVASSPPSLPTQAQPKLPTIKLWMGSEEINAELALTEQQQQTGMMFRTNRLEDSAGMLFVFPGPWQANFWMKNCPVPLSAAYIDANGVILEVVALHAQETTGVVAQTANVQYVLEMNEGWFQRHNIGPGTLIRTEKGSFRETFFGR